MILMSFNTPLCRCSALYERVYAARLRLSFRSGGRYQHDKSRDSPNFTSAKRIEFPLRQTLKNLLLTYQRRRPNYRRRPGNIGGDNCPKNIVLPHEFTHSFYIFRANSVASPTPFNKATGFYCCIAKRVTTGVCFDVKFNHFFK